MSVDREQVRKDAETEIQFGDQPYDALADHCLALLAELEEAEKIANYNASRGESWRDKACECLDVLKEANEGAERLADRLARVQQELDESRVNGATLALRVPALVEAVKNTPGFRSGVWPELAAAIEAYENPEQKQGGYMMGAE